jgi:hypothetical protein
MHAPRTPHLEAINRILRYLKGTLGKGVWMKNNNSNNICGYFDADWAGSFDRKSTTGFYTFVGGNFATWKSKKQSVVVWSSAEAEYRAMASIASELIWIDQLLMDMGIEIQSSMKIFCDNQATRHIASNPVFNKRTKHIEVGCHFVREKIQAKKIETPFMRSKDQVADIFTKELESKPFEENSNKLEMNKLGMIDIYAPNLRESVEKYKELRVNFII